MEFDFSPFYQKPNNWLPTNIEYEGEGVAEFQDPHGRIYGHTEITLDEFGEFIVDIQVDRYESEQPLQVGWHQLLSSVKPHQVGGTWFIAMPPPRNNLCLQLTVTTAQGKFTAKNIDVFSQWGEENVRFYPNVSQFDENNSSRAKYWVMPLVNFVSQFMQYDPNLAKHPLRIYPDTELPADIPEEHKQRASFVATGRSRFVLFEFSNAVGFIERLPDYEEKEQQLKKHKKPSAITAVTVGEIGANSIELDEFERWFPFHFLELLGLATGNEVNTPWVEFRDEYGNLVRRIHAASFRRPLFLEGQRAIDEIHHRGTGRLLTASLACGDLYESYLRVALTYTVLGGRNEQNIEDKLTHFCRALDALCEHFGLSKQDLLSLTSDIDKAEIQEAIQQASLRLRSIKEKAQKSGDTAQTRYLEIVIGRLLNAANRESNFGLSVCELLQKFNFPDADILDKHFEINPRKDKITNWAGLISYYRIRVIHVGYFNFASREHEVRDVDTVTLHLQDILVRILLTILGYDGKYGPIMRGPAYEEPVSWVQSDTTARELGYK